MIDLYKYEAIIFDLGGVIINIDYHATIRAFEELNIPQFEQLYTQAKQNQVFDQLETGQLSNKDFRDYIRRESRLDLTDEQIDNAWNQMLLDIPQKRIEFLKKLGTKKPIYLLSNTNAIHIEWFGKYLAENHEGFDKFNHLFQNVHYSHLLEERKPNASCFEKVLDLNNLNPEKTLFIDDSEQHIEGAQKVGLKTYHLVNEDIVDLLKT